MLHTIFVLSLTLASLVAAGQHGAAPLRDPRRHHHRLARRAAPPCAEGGWQCTGTQLQQCVNSDWKTVRDCTGENMVCSAVADNTGCIWSWDAAAPVEPSPSASASTSSSMSASITSSDGDLPIPTRTHGWYTRPGDEWDDASSTVTSAGSESSSSTSTESATSVWSSTSTSSSRTSEMSTSASSPGTGLDGPSQYPSAEPSSSLSQGYSSSASAGQNASMSTTTSTPEPTGGTGSTVNWNAPHHVVYSDYWLQSMPDVSLLIDFNRFILAFWMSERGAVDNAQMWEWMDPAARQKVLDSYHAAGIALMVSAFGSTDSPVSNGIDPVDCARGLAAWVKEYNLDGVDIDWEDMHAMNSGIGEAWLITFQSELRRQLPAGQYLISHAPVAPWFTSGPNYPNGAYVAVHKQTGDGIDFYNMQFYNQGQGVYEDCQSLVFNSGSNWPSTSVMEMNSHAGIPLSKIVIGKPINAGAANNGYMDPSSLNQCVRQAKQQGWNGGVMYWEWNSDTPRMMATTLS